MGEVFLAEDTSLDRKVALKFLPEELQQDDIARKRFLREAKSAAALDHPYICNIHEVGEVDGKGFISMEYVEGETLGNLLLDGPLSINNALSIATEIAEALEKAHRGHIVHRDLKPSNIMRTPDGHVKVMDFGTAKRIAPEEGGSQERTLTALTQEGSTLGTLAYMSPEQLKGEEVDTRSDIFSFGIVLYEMLAGVHPFLKGQVMETASSILHEDPIPLVRYRESVTEVLQHMVRKMLAKEPSRRYQSVHEVQTNLVALQPAALLAAQIETAEESPSGERGRYTEAQLGVGAGLVGLVSVAIGALLTWLLLVPAPPPELPKRLSLSLDYPLDVAEIEPRLNRLLSIAPDGSALAYLGRTGGTSRLYLMSLDGTPSAPVSGTEGARAPFFSPDGNWLGFLVGTEMRMVPLEGGASVTIGSSLRRSRATWATWATGEGIVFANPEGIFRTKMEDPEPVRIGVPQEGRIIKDPVPLPGGKAVLLASKGPLLDDSSRVEVLSVGTGERRVLVEEGGSPSFVPLGASTDKGYLLYALGGRLFAAPLDVTSLQLVGPSVAVVDNVLMRPTGGTAQYSFSSTGVLVYAKDEGIGISELVRVDDAGRAQRLSEEHRRYATPRLSPDGSRLAVEVHEIPHQIWLLDIEKDQLSRFTFENSNHYFAWCPDGRSILYTSDTGDGVQLLWKQVDSPGEPVMVYSGNPEAWIGSLSRDGRFAAIQSSTGEPVTLSDGVSQRSQGRSFDVYLLPLDGGSPPQPTGRPIPVATSHVNERDPWISPDGACVAYVEWEAGTSDVYVACLDEGIRRQVSVGGGREPIWSRTGTEIYFRSENRMMKVEVEREPEFRAGTPRALFEGSYRHFNPANFDVNVADQSFVRLRAVGRSSSARHLAIHLDWFKELEIRLGETEF